MSAPRIYADFNGLEVSPRDPQKVCLSLHYFGSLRDLARLRLSLDEGQRLMVYSDSPEGQDLEAEATVFFDRRRGHWFAEFERDAIRYDQCSPEPPRSGLSLLRLRR